ncbi:MAG: MerR family transcriptional regulator, partial [Acidimicrobiales bacterium]
MRAPAPAAAPAPVTTPEAGPAPAPAGLVSIGAAASLLGVTERALRYYQQLGLVTPCFRTAGGMRRYSQEDLARVGRIRELQSLLGLNLDEVAVVLGNEDRMAEIRQVYHDERTGAGQRAELARECLCLQEHLRATVEAKREALHRFLADLDRRIARARA